MATKDEYEVQLPQPLQPPPAAAVRVRELHFDLRPDGSWTLVARGLTDSGREVEGVLRSADLSATKRRYLRGAFGSIAAAITKLGRWEVA